MHSSKPLLRDCLARAWYRRMTSLLVDQREWPPDMDLAALNRFYESASHTHKRLLAQVLIGTLYTRTRASKMDDAISPYCPICSALDDLPHRLSCSVPCGAPPLPSPVGGIIQSIIPRLGTPNPPGWPIDYEPH
jgi:hypothetical protein